MTLDVKAPNLRSTQDYEKFLKEIQRYLQEVARLIEENRRYSLMTGDN